MRYYTLRPAIAMIELIFALVIMGIVLMSAPMLVSTATKSGYVALQQEAIATTAAEIGMILTHHWDEADTNTTRSSPVLQTNGDVELNEKSIGGSLTGRRAGTPSSSKRTFVDSIGTRLTAALPANFTTEGDFDDIDDFTGNTNSVVSYEAASMSDGDVIDTAINLATTVTYISDAASYNGGTTLTLSNPFNTAPAVGFTPSNIKYINVTLTTGNTNQELNKTISLNAFSCNIGTYSLNERTLP